MRLGGDDVLYGRVSFTQPEACFRWDGAGKPRPTAIRTTSVADFSRIEVRRESATSRDGTRIR